MPKSPVRPWQPDSNKIASGKPGAVHSDLSQFLDRELVEQSIDEGVIVRPPQPGILHSCFADPAGGRGDSFAAAISHSEGNNQILDCLFEAKSLFNPSQVVETLRIYCALTTLPKLLATDMRRIG